MGFADIWDKSEGVQQNRDLPNGKYICKVIECKNGETKAGMPKIEWVLEVAAGEYKGTKTWIHRVLDQNNQFTIDLAKTDFLNLKVDCSSSAMNKTMKELVGKYILLDLHLSKKGDSQVKDIVKFEDVPADMPPASASPF